MLVQCLGITYPTDSQLVSSMITFEKFDRVAMSIDLVLRDGRDGSKSWVCSRKIICCGVPINFKDYLFCF